MTTGFGKLIRYGQTVTAKTVDQEMVEAVVRSWDDIGVWVVAYESLRWYPWANIVYLEPHFDTDGESGDEN